MPKREIEWLLLQTSGREYYTVVSHHLTYPKGEAKYPYPTREAAEAFAKRASMHPAISHAEVLDPKGRLVLDYNTTHKHTVSWTDTGRGMVEARECPDKKPCKEI